MWGKAIAIRSFFFGVVIFLSAYKYWAKQVFLYDTVFQFNTQNRCL